jgi:hypothetical protein
MTPSPSYSGDDYQTVAERIKIFREKYPEGSLRPADLEFPFRLLTIGDQNYVVVTAAAYRSQDDRAPGVGQAWELIPGTTEYTRGSELMVAETGAWGRAIIAVLAADSKKIATADEVRAAQDRRGAPGPQAQPAPQPQPQVGTVPQAPVAAAPQPVQIVAQPPQQAVAPDAHDPSDNADNRSLVDSVINNVLKHQGSTVQDVREAWTVLSQARLLAWRVDPFAGIDPDNDGKVTIGSLVAHVGRVKQEAAAPPA